MKKLLSFLVIALPISLMAQDGLSKATINGNLKNIEGNPTTLFYTYRIADSTVQDSVPIKDSLYALSVTGEMPLRIYLSIADPTKPTDNKNVAAVFVEEGVNTISSVDSFSNISVKESIAQAEYEKLNKAAEPFQKQAREISQSYSKLKEKNDTAGMRKIEEDFEALQNKMTDEVYGNYVKNNPTSPLALYALSQYAGYDIDAAKVEPLFLTLPEARRTSNAGKRFQEKLNIAKATSVGAIAPSFSQTDTSGALVDLASFKGKYVLVDFWASWCGPCRAENPNVVAAFNKYKDKNFTVLGVSLDDEENEGRDKWLAAISKDKLTWTQVSDLKGWSNAVAKQYGIQAIPQNFLLDPSGKIIAKDIRGEELQQKLEEILN